MTKTTNNTFKTEKNKLSNQPIHLFTVHDYDGASNNLTYAAYPEAVTYDGVTYNPFPISFDSIKENNQSQIDTVTIKVSNISRTIQGYLETYNFRGLKVTIKTVWANQLGDSNAFIDDIYYIDSYSADQNDVDFTLTSKFDVMDISLPRRRYLRNYCQWKFKSDECGYAGVETECNKTKQDCKDNKENLSRFGGFPSINQKGIFIS